MHYLFDWWLCWNQYFLKILNIKVELTVWDRESYVKLTGFLSQYSMLEHGPFICLVSKNNLSGKL